MADLTSAQVPPVGPEDHVRGEGLEVVLYVDLGCPHCAATWQGISDLPLSICFRHFPLASQHPRSPVLHAAAEAAALQDAFWPIVDRLFADRGRTDDPHLWEAASDLGLDLEGFQRDRRSPEVAARVQRDFRSGVRAGASSTPAAFVGGVAVTPPLHRELRRLSGD
jgi:NhaA family Na+:H+ antiporter